MSGLQCRGSFRPVNAYRYARCRRSDPGGRGSVSLALRIPRMASFLSVTWACDGDSNAGGASHEGPVLRILKEWGRRSWRVLTNVCFDSRPGYPPHVELRPRASAPDPNFDPARKYKLRNLRRLPHSPAVVWDVCDLYVSGTCPQRLAPHRAFRGGQRGELWSLVHRASGMGALPAHSSVQRKKHEPRQHHRIPWQWRRGVARSPAGFRKEHPRSDSAGDPCKVYSLSWRGITAEEAQVSMSLWRVCAHARTSHTMHQVLRTDRSRVLRCESSTRCSRWCL